jgi:pilus assembly protein Flp/PilA
MKISTNLKKLISQFIQEEKAVTAIEYALIASLIAVAIIVAVRSVGTNVSAIFTSIATAL